MRFKPIEILALLVCFLPLTVGDIRLGLGHLVVPAGQIDITTAAWKLVGDVDLGFFRNVSEMINENMLKFVELRKQVESKINPVTQAQYAIFPHKFQVKTDQLIGLATALEVELGNLMTLLHVKPRVKRGWFDGVGVALKEVFGTATVSQVSDLSEALEKLKQAGVAQHDIVDKQVTLMKNLLITEHKQGEIIQTITKKLQTLDSYWKTVSSTVEKVKSQAFEFGMELAYTELHQMLIQIRQKLYILELDLNSLASGKLPVHMLNPNELLKTLRNISGILPTKYKLPVSDLTNVWPYYHQFAKTSTFLTEDGLRILTEIPLVSITEMYDLFKIISFPTVDQNFPNNLTTVHVSQPYIAIKRDERTQYVELTDDDLHHCVNAGTTVCSLSKPVQKRKANSCNYALYNEIFSDIAEFCKITFKPFPSDSEPIIRHVIENWWAFTANKIKASLSCNGELKSTINFDGSSLFQIEPGCSLFSDSFTIPESFSGFSKVKLTSPQIAIVKVNDLLKIPKLEVLEPRILEKHLSVPVVRLDEADVSLKQLERSIERNEPIIRSSYEAVELIRKRVQPYEWMSLASAGATVLIPTLLLVSYHCFCNTYRNKVFRRTLLSRRYTNQPTRRVQIRATPSEQWPAPPSPLNNQEISVPAPPPLPCFELTPLNKTPNKPRRTSSQTLERI